MHSTQGIILKIHNFREHDERVILYTKDAGKLSVVAKGAKKIEAKLRGNLDLFNLVDVSFVPGVNFNILTSVDLTKKFLSIGSNVDTYKSALSMSYITDNIFDENAKDEEFFDMLKYSMEKLNEYGKESEYLASLYSWLLLKKFQMKILETEGYEDNLFTGHARANLGEELAGKFKLSGNSLLLMDMLRGKTVKSVTLSKNDMRNIENIFTRLFAYIFSCKLNPWMPIMN
ncbi:MAG: DNA repair protein RecO [Candidatus Spechtbacteria bacterium RIFCSPHIGHO2_02_FULL_43_15b]|uniref:DNA repair protein RecO n=1 Tax=Candidatus Spechtbacteria bacterium RIFCSPHIGHO2_01_FULL_43_30 TaxID=1802158 RepID=A0A1G2H6P4_9BACT|nr:MAG: DNA repair protein RecO [Candidatus Spechtbacteria bacterium RIFCSPHIGHO2_01_FULL_43_30]OGZ60213.1 MAG: DNA repair protein RecO [Candidatus Spechtbacteria bacterium RIFCSPHIGHO2_02_FULL_43_15b]